MKTYLLSLLVVITTFSNAQVLFQNPGSKNVEKALSNKLSVVLTGDKKTDSLVQEAFRDYWKAGDFEFISIKDFEVQVRDINKSFCLDINVISSQGSGKSFYAIINGGRKGIWNYSDESFITGASKNIFYDEEIEKYPSIYTYMIKGMNDILMGAKKGDLSGKLEKSVEKLNSKFPEIAKNRTLIINKDLRRHYSKNELVIEEEDMKTYPFDYKFVSREEFEEYMNSDDNSVWLLYPVMDLTKHIYILDPSTKEVVFFRYEKSGYFVKSKDIKAIAAGES